MKATAVLLGYAVLVGGVGARWLPAAQWRLRAPRLALAAWGLVLVGSSGSLVLAGLLVAAPDARVAASLADLLHACASAVGQAYRAPGDAAVHAAGAGVALGLPLWVLGTLVVSGWSDSRRRAAHLRGLRLVARSGPVPGVLVLDHHVPAAYCLGGSRGVVVVTSSALAVLNDGELLAVLAHERAHRTGRHHLVLSMTRALAGSVAILAPSRLAMTAVGELLEMLADDMAVRRAGRVATRRALVKMAGPLPGPAVGLAAGDTSVLLRVQRLRRSPRPMQPASRSALLVAGVWVLAVPVLVAAAPALAALRWDYCPLA